MSPHTTHRIIVMTLVAVLVIGVGAPGAAPAMTDSTVTAAAKHKKKRKAVKCRKNQVPIKLKRRTVGCRSLRAALPAPRQGDPAFCSPRPRSTTTWRECAIAGVGAHRH